MVRRIFQGHTYMNCTIAICICLSILLSISNERLLDADEPQSFEIPTGSDAAELSKLADDYERLNKLRNEAVKATPEGLDSGGKRSDETLSDEEWLKAGREIDTKSP